MIKEFDNMTKKIIERKPTESEIAEAAGREMPTSPKNEDIYNRSMQDNQFMKAIISSLNKAGAFSIAGERLSRADLKSLIKSNM